MTDRIEQQGELCAAAVAKEFNLPYILSTAGSQPIERVAEVNGQGPRFFQVNDVLGDTLFVTEARQTL